MKLINNILLLTISLFIIFPNEIIGQSKKIKPSLKVEDNQSSILINNTNKLTKTELIDIVENEPKVFYIDTIQVDSNNVPIHKNQFYFPLYIFPEVESHYEGITDGSFTIKREIKKGKFDTFVLKWYSSQLYAMKEPLLYNKKINKQVFRFTWLRTFDNPIIVRLEKTDKCTLTWKMSDGAGGYDPGNLIIEKSKEIELTKWDDLQKLISKSDFWNLDLGRISSGLDGSEWILEGYEPTRYRAITAWTPREGKFYEACCYLLNLTDLDIKKIKMY